MDNDAVQGPPGPPGWPLDDTTLVTNTQAAGGIIESDTHPDSVVYLAITGQHVDDKEPVTHRFLLTADQHFQLVAQLEHAGRTSLLAGTGWTGH